MSQHDEYGYPFNSEFKGISPEGFPQGDRDGSADDLAAFTGFLLTDGVSPDGMAVTHGSGLTLSISAGTAVIRGRLRSFKQQFVALSVSAVTQTWNIVIRLDSEQERRIWCFPTTDPPKNTEFVRDLVIANVTVNANQATIESIQDTRDDRELCGYTTAVGWPGYQPPGDIPGLVWDYAIFPNTLTEEQKRIVETTPSLYEIYLKSIVPLMLAKPVFRRERFTEAGVFTAPVDGTYFVRVQASGGQGTPTAGSSTMGGGGGYGEKAVPLKRNDTVNVSVSSASNQNASFGSYITAYTGTVGTVSVFGTLSAEGGNCVGGDINIKGGTAIATESNGVYSQRMGDAHLSTTHGLNLGQSGGYGGGGATNGMNVYPAGGGIVIIDWIEYEQQDLPADVAIRTQIFTVAGDVSVAPKGASVGDQILNGGTATHTIAGVSAAIGDLIKITKLSPLTGVFNGNIRGATGATGAPGPTGVGLPGAEGKAATIVVDSTATGEPGSQALVENIGTSNAAMLKFTIPPGGTGPVGPQGIQGNTGGVTAPISSFFTTYVDAEGELFVVTPAGGTNPLRFDEETGDLYFTLA